MIRSYHVAGRAKETNAESDLARSLCAVAAVSCVGQFAIGHNVIVQTIVGLYNNEPDDPPVTQSLTVEE